jgi:hypothetical protein
LEAARKAEEDTIANSTIIKGKGLFRNNNNNGKGGSSGSGPSDISGSTGTGGSASHKFIEL